MADDNLHSGWIEIVRWNTKKGYDVWILANNFRGEIASCKSVYTERIVIIVSVIINYKR